jgi:hypothetical protein
LSVTRRVGQARQTPRCASARNEVRAAHGVVDLARIARWSDVKLAVKTDRKAKWNTSAGLAALDVAKPGKLDVILSNATYVDVVRDGRVLKSIGHTDLKTCTGFRKSVSFDVVPGRYIVQLTDAPARTVKMATVLR